MPLSNLDLSMWDRRCGLWKYPSLCFRVSYPAFSASCRALCASNGNDEAGFQPHKANVSVPNSTWSETVFATSEWHESCETRAAGFFGTRMPSCFFDIEIRQKPSCNARADQGSLEHVSKKKKAMPW